MANLEFTLGDFSDMLGHLRDVLAMSGNFCPCSIIMQISFVQSLLNESKLNVKFKIGIHLKISYCLDGQICIKFVVCLSYEMVFSNLQIPKKMIKN